MTGVDSGSARPGCSPCRSSVGRDQSPCLPSAGEYVSGINPLSSRVQRTPLPSLGVTNLTAPVRTFRP